MAFSVSATITPSTFSKPLNSHHLPFLCASDINDRKTHIILSSKTQSSLRVSASANPTTVVDTACSEQLEIPNIVNDDGSSADSEQREQSSKFSWGDHWYPVSIVEDLDPKLPTPFQLLGRDIVLWFNKSINQWVAFDDKCPHRLAPLSEGRIDENGDLQCSYHGWSFGGCGSCTRIPQAKSEGPEARAVKSPRACATKFPTMVSQGLLFVWPDENGWEKANATQPPRLPDDFENPDFAAVSMQRDLSYGYDILLENVLDPSHIDFAHHKVDFLQVEGRREKGKPFPFKVESSGPWGFAGANDDNPKYSSKFLAPCNVLNKFEIKLPTGDQNRVIWICFFIVPMAPGKTRSIICSARNFAKLSVPGKSWWQVVPRWLEHCTFNRVFDGDMIVLQGQEKFFHSQATEHSIDINAQYTSLTFTPTQADRFVLGFRNWLRRHGNGQPEWVGPVTQQPLLPSTVKSKREMMDRFEQHTVKCSSCKGAYESFKMWQKILIAASVALAATSGIPSVIQYRIILTGLAIVSAAIAYALYELQKKFVFVDYVHAHID